MAMPIESMLNKLISVKFYKNIKGEQMDKSHPSVVVKMDFRGKNKFFIFQLTSDAKDFGIKVRSKSNPELHNAYITNTQMSMMVSKIRNMKELVSARNLLYGQNKRREGDKIKLGDVAEFQSDRHVSELVKNVAVCDKTFYSSEYTRTNDEFFTDVCTRFAKFVGKGLLNFYDEQTLETITLTENEQKNLISKLINK